MRKMTKEEFISRSHKKHNNYFNYDKVNFINTRSKVVITCPKHGDFEQIVSSHLMGKGCNSCSTLRGSKKQRLEDKEWREKAEQVHNNKYDYPEDNTPYENNRTKVQIICPEHGPFLQTVGSHLGGCGCPKCGNKKSSKKQRLGLEEFIRRATEKHGDKYDYSLVIDYKNNQTKVQIRCRTHGSFYQVPSWHLGGGGCPHCAGCAKKTIKEFIKDAIQVHGDAYDYRNFTYINAKTKGEIICNKCKKTFFQKPNNHLLGKGCSSCKSSKGELKVAKILKKYDVEYYSEHSFPECKYVHVLKFDFWLPTYNLCIEYDGEQHFIKKAIFGGKEGFQLTQQRDQIKNQYCQDNGIRLVRISYKQFNEIENILNNFLI